MSDILVDPVRDPQLAAMAPHLSRISALGDSTARAIYGDVYTRTKGLPPHQAYTLASMMMTDIFGPPASATPPAPAAPAVQAAPVEQPPAAEPAAPQPPPEPAPVPLSPKEQFAADWVVKAREILDQNRRSGLGYHAPRPADEPPPAASATTASPAPQPPARPATTQAWQAPTEEAHAAYVDELQAKMKEIFSRPAGGFAGSRR